MTHRRFSADEVRQIRALGRRRRQLREELETLTVTALAKRYGTSKQRIWAVQEYETYRDVREDFEQ